MVTARRTPAAPPLLIALTGGMGSGKSTVSRLLRVMGFPVYDCDSRARALMEGDDRLRHELREAFGSAIYRRDGTLDRPRLAALAFGNAATLRRLNEMVHPAVGRDLRAWATAGAWSVAFYESAILFESGFDRYASRIWCVAAPDELRIARCRLRDGSTRDEILARMAQQMPQDEKARRADAVIINDVCHSVILQVQTLLHNVEAPVRRAR